MPLEEMRALLDRHARPDLTTAIDGVQACRFEHTAPPVSGMSGTMLAVIAQGGKRLALGERLYEYRAGQYLVTSVDLPVTGHVMDTGRTTLAFGMTLHAADIAALLLEADPQDLPAQTRVPQAGAAVTDAPAELLDAIVRLLRLLNHPGDRKVLAPMIKREILWRLLSGEQGPTIRQLGLADSSLAHISRTVQWIRENFAQPFRVDELAHLAGMSVSAFHRNFQVVTGMSPIRFQKHIRLQEARLLLAGRPSDITGVGHAVGYDSSSQFSREYHRMFGMPPSQDTVHLRPQTAAPAAALP